MQRSCPVCDLPLKNDSDVVAVVLSRYVELESDVHYAITPPTQCVEIIHHGCYDFPDDKDGHFMKIES